MSHNLSEKFKNSEKIIPLIAFLWLLTLAALGSWWIYLIEKIGHQFNHLHHSLTGLNANINISRMIYWEGGFFLLLTLSLFFVMIFLFLKDRYRSRAIQSFFVSVGHEIKNPLASITAQTEMLEAALTHSSSPIVQKYLKKLQNSSKMLEAQIDNLLYLSKIELHSKTILTTINIEQFIRTFINKEDVTNINFHSDIIQKDIVANELALQVILRNLFENSQKHAPKTDIEISLEETKDHIILNYTNKNKFLGNNNKLGKLFYTFDSAYGSGIGLYLIRHLTEQQQGFFEIKFEPYLLFKLHFIKAEEYNE